MRDFPSDARFANRSVSIDNDQHEYILFEGITPPEMLRIDPVSLELFLVAARLGSIKRAADSEHIAQSALSRRIADLEHALGVRLLIRSPLGVTLTEAPISSRLPVRFRRSTGA